MKQTEFFPMITVSEQNSHMNACVDFSLFVIQVQVSFLLLILMRVLTNRGMTRDFVVDQKQTTFLCCAIFIDNMFRAMLNDT